MLLPIPFHGECFSASHRQTGDDAEHVFQAERHTRPVVCLHLRHGHNEVCCQNALWYPQRIEPCEGRRHLHLPHVVSIQIHETQLAVPQLRLKAALSENEIRVPLVARSFLSRRKLIEQVDGVV